LHKPRECHLKKEEDSLGKRKKGKQKELKMKVYQAAFASDTKSKKEVTNNDTQSEEEFCNSLTSN
jgi:hypothetical protein